MINKKFEKFKKVTSIIESSDLALPRHAWPYLKTNPIQSILHSSKFDNHFNLDQKTFQRMFEYVVSNSLMLQKFSKLCYEHCWASNVLLNFL